MGRRSKFHGDPNSPARLAVRKAFRKVTHDLIERTEERTAAFFKKRNAARKAARDAAPKLEGDVNDYLARNPEPLCKRFPLSENEDE